MPIYEYAPLSNDCPICQGRFEALQKMSESALDTCPTCGRPCRRLISVPHIGYSTHDLLASVNLVRHGFTQYRRAGGGIYEKTAGVGPNHISADQ
ncbi:MAG: zinc ribbon domain-containing protein [Candidatus Competibacteraceae bacterium]|jgi:putative FmdB family regulatory protein|nr:zinc ribbon domain-containing protein [Candidatus Competibacteraceae bacterium]